MTTIYKHEIRSGNFDTVSEEKSFPDDFPILWQFPKEFQRNWFKQLDPRFMIILLSTFIVEICILLLLLSHLKNAPKAVDVNTIQQQYARLLLNEFVHDNSHISDIKTPDTYLYGVPEETEQTTIFVEDQGNLEVSFGTEHSMESAGGSEGKGSINNVPSESSVGQVAGDQKFHSYGNKTPERIGSQGLLQYITSDRNKVSNDELQEIFAQGDRNALYLEGSLENVNVSNLKQGSGRGTGSDLAGGSMPYSKLKGSKSDVSIDEVRSSMTPLGKVTYRTVAKNTELEDVSASELSKTGSKASARKAENVTKVILSHNRTIQDCYKQALKKDPILKGKVVVRFSVNPAGSVTQVNILQSTIDYEPMLNCIVNRIRRWKDFGESELSLGMVSYRQTYVFGY